MIRGLARGMMFVFMHNALGVSSSVRLPGYHPRV